MKKFMTMFLIAASFCLISCGNNAVETNEPAATSTIEATIENTTQNVQEEVTYEVTETPENAEEEAVETTPAAEEIVSPTAEN